MRTALITIAAGFAALGLYAAETQPPPPTSGTLDSTLRPLFEPSTGPFDMEAFGVFSNFRLILNYDALNQAEAAVYIGGVPFELPVGEGKRFEITCEDAGSNKINIRTGLDGKDLGKGKVAKAEKDKGPAIIPVEKLSYKQDFTLLFGFRSDGTNELISWSGGNAVIMFHDGLIAFSSDDGSASPQTKSGPDTNFIAVLTRKDGDFKWTLKKAKNPSPDVGVKGWQRALTDEEIENLINGNIQGVNTADFDGDSMPVGYKLTLKAGKGIELHDVHIQSLEKSDHSEIVAAWNEESYKRGEVIYNQLCATCHGTREAPGSLPTAPRFHMGAFNNGSDPYRMYQTLEKGYGMMVPQPQYTTAQKYDVIHYIREHFIRDGNEKYYTDIDDEYLSKLPRGLSLEKEQETKKRPPQYLLQDFGDVLFWTLQVEKDNIAQKGITIRLDDGPGGVSKGNSWALYDHDTMRLAAVWTGDKFVDWRGIAFDGSHGTHTSIVGDKKFVFPNEPMWANPETQGFEDLRIEGRDGKRYGPLPREWVHFKGLDITGDRPVLVYTVGDCEVRERPAITSDGVFERWLDFSPSEKTLRIKLNEERIHGLSPGKKGKTVRIRYEESGPVLSKFPNSGKKGDNRNLYEGTITTQIQKGKDQGAWAVDVLTLPKPDDNPWQSWMRASGIDFMNDGKSAVVCTWNGDVWIVDGIDQSEGELQWQRICAGLFQPLGVKIVEGEIYVTCRDMIAHLKDVDGDREIDIIESFNNDHQVTEHFHEFAMGLQTDDEGNFYYAKSARHAKTAVVPHHGTLLKVSKDGLKTEILATGFRAANGVCLNPDGGFMVTDQEGHWNPKNRINWVKGTGKDDFYGNMYGYHDVTDSSDSAMTQPLCWITNKFDRSPAELLWVPEDSAWKPLHGSLLNLSYGEGRIYTVPYEKTSKGVQGGMAVFPIERFPTGVMRGRFNPIDGQLYACGMFAWAGNQQQPTGFYRVRYTGKPACQPIGLDTDPNTIEITFSDPVDPASVKGDSFKIRAWDLKRTKNYGSKHFNERELKVEKAIVSDDGRTVALTIPDLVPTWGMSINLDILDAEGTPVKREIHNSIFTLE